MAAPAADLFQTHDLTAAEEALSRTCTSLRLHASDEHPASRRGPGRRLPAPVLRLEQRSCGPLLQLPVAFGISATARCDPFGAWVYTQVRSGKVSFTVRRGEHDQLSTHGQGVADLGSTPEEAYATAVDALLADVTVIAPELLSRVTDDADATRASSAHRTSRQPRRWRGPPVHQ